MGVLCCSALCIAACTGPQDALPSGELRVLTYNVHGLPPTITGDDTPGRMVQIGPLLQPYDIVALQEDFDTDNHTLLVQDTDYPTQVVFDDPLSDRVYGSGLSLLARSEEVFHHHTHYSACYGTIDNSSDCLASKGLQFVRLELDGGEHSLDLLNTHHEAGGGDEDNAAREVQVGEVLGVLESLSTGRAVLFGGDFNLSGEDAHDASLVARYLDEGGLSEGCDAIDCAEPGRIDRFFFRSSDSLRLTPLHWEVQEGFIDDSGTPLSDHDPIAMTFRWEVLATNPGP